MRISQVRIGVACALFGLVVAGKRRHERSKPVKTGGSGCLREAIRRPEHRFRQARLILYLAPDQGQLPRRHMVPGLRFWQPLPSPVCVPAS
jgi:hypothetical protein